MKLSRRHKNTPFPVQLEGELHTAPFSEKTCVWFDWIHSAEKLRHNSGYTTGTWTDENSIIVKSDNGILTGFPSGIMLYIAPSFDGKAIIDGAERYVWEFCLEPGREYYAFAEKFSYHLPPLFFLPRRRSTLLLALSDTPLEKGRPVHPLIPVCRGRTG